VPELRLDEKVIAIDEALAAAGVAHAFGGAIALGFYAEPRATYDIDVNIFVPADRSGAVLSTLVSLGVDITGGGAAIDRADQCRVYWDLTPVDLFFSGMAFHEAMSRAVRTVDYGDHRMRIIAPEHLMVCKALFDRHKDWLDIEQMLVTVEDLRVAEVRRWMTEIAGADDARTRRLDALIREMLAR
jgi:hypothetical protein